MASSYACFLTQHDIIVYNLYHQSIKSVKTLFKLFCILTKSAFLIKSIAAVIWLKYCRYGAKHYIINPSSNQSKALVDFLLFHVSFENISLIYIGHVEASL